MFNTLRVFLLKLKFVLPLLLGYAGGGALEHFGNPYSPSALVKKYDCWHNKANETTEDETSFAEEKPTETK